MTDSPAAPAAASGTLAIGGLEVHRLGFGTMQLAGPGVWGPPSDHATAVAVLRRVVELGVDLIDTADAYGPFVVEELIREALHPYGPVRIATKAGFLRTGPDEWSTFGRPDYIRQACELSLGRLGVEQIDLFQLHRIDPKVPADEQFGVLKDLRDEGKVAEVGLSEVNVADVESARRIVPIATVQNHYNVANRSAEDLLDYCEREGIGFIPWFPLASGKLARPGGPLDDVAKQTGASVPQVSLAWLLRRSPVMLPIPGTSSLAHAEANCAAAEVQLSDAQYDELTSARRPLRRWAMS
jgi:pyridoxine 4-dehydrogenase